MAQNERVSADPKTPLVQSSGEVKDSPNRFLTIILCFIALAAMLGIVLAFPMSILVPESLNLGLTVGQAVLIVSARPATSVIVIFIQPSMNKLDGPCLLDFYGDNLFPRVLLVLLLSKHSRLLLVSGSSCSCSFWNNFISDQQQNRGRYNKSSAR